MLNNPYFWAGEIGLLLTVISGLMLLYQLRTQPLLTKVFMLFAVFMSLHMLVRPIVVNMSGSIPASPYLYRLAVGLVFASRAWYYMITADIVKDPVGVRTAGQILRWSTVAGTVLLTYIYYRLRNK